MIGSPVSLARWLIMAWGKPFGVFIPVPVAVPPWGTSLTLGRVASTRSIAYRICAA